MTCLSRRYEALFALCLLLVGVLASAFSPEQPAHASAPRRQLFVLLQPIGSKLTATEARQHIVPNRPESFGQVGGIVPFLKRHGFSHADFLMYSYTGDTGNGTPKPYDCAATLAQPLLTDILHLHTQLLHALKSNPNTDVYLIGHSLGGVIAFGYLSLFMHTFQKTFPAGARLKAVITLDAVLGGIPLSAASSPAYLTRVFGAYLTFVGCTVSVRNLIVPDLITIFSSASKTPPPDDAGTDPQGAQATVLSVVGRYDNSNEQLAERAHALGISVLAIGNTNDFISNPHACIRALGNFLDTQFLEDEGDNSGLYSRSFVGKPTTCHSLATDVPNSHLAVLTDKTVQAGLLHFLTPMVGATPVPLTPVPGPDNS